MPISRASFLRSTLLLLLLGLLALTCVVVTSIWLVQRTQDYFDDVVAIRRLRAATVDLRSVLQDAETGQRGFLLTLKDPYLAPFEDAVAKLDPQIEKLRSLSERQPDIRQLVERLVPVIRDKMAELNDTVRLAQQGRQEEAIAVVQDDHGKLIMQQARDLFAEIVKKAETRLNDLVLEQNTSAQALWWVSVVGGLVILLVTAIGMLTIIRYVREIVEARRQLDELNTGLEERVRERTSELGRANEEVQRFAYIVTHDLRAPLVNIMGFTSELEESIRVVQAFINTLEMDPNLPDYQAAKVATQEDLPEALNFIRSSTRKMDGLINAILKLSREGRRTLKPEPVNLPVLIENAAAAIAHQVFEANGEVGLDVQAPVIVTDRLSLEQAIGNLLDNAVKYRRRDVPLRIDVRVRREPGNQVAIVVEDNGRGIAVRDHERVFELFRRSGAQDQPGEGIGLAHVRAMIRNLGGDITLESTFGQGTRFKITLPANLRISAGSIAA